MSTNSNENSLPLSGGSDAPPSVPTFTCLVYLSKDESGVTHARVANLGSCEAKSASPRDAMARVCREFKQRLRSAHANGETMDWIDPPLVKRPDEQVRSIPVHL